MAFISVVVPVFNEERNIPLIYEELKTVLSGRNLEYEVIFVDDGSKDSSLSILKEISSSDDKIKVLSFSRNFGHQVAVTAGLEHVKGDAAVIIDADLQDPPEMIASMVDKWRQGYEVVYARRVRRKGETFFKKFTASFFYRLLRSLTQTDIPLDTGDFRLMDRKVVEALNGMKEKNRFIRGLVSWVGFNQTGIEFERQERMYGETKYPLKKMIRFALNGIFSFSDKPLKLATFIGVCASLLGFVLILWSLFQRIFLSEWTVRGWASVFIAVLFMGGIQLLSLGIIGEYISRIYDESKNRPTYILKERINVD